jgi:Anti-sigma factor NepR
MGGKRARFHHVEFPFRLRLGGVLEHGRTTMSDRVPPPELKARRHREAMAAIGRRLRLFYVAEARRTLPDRLQQLLRALDQSERKHFATRTGHTPEGRGVGGGRPHIA